jgi:GTPase SAR1 family protein
MANTSITIGVIGNSNVGKTTLIKANSEGYSQGVGVSTLRDGDKTRALIICDLGQVAGYPSERIRVFRDVDAMIVMVDLSKKRETKDFSDEEHWLTDIREYGKANMPVVLVGSKYDLLEENPGEMDFIHAFAREHNLVFYPSSTADPETLVFPVSNLLDRMIHGGDDF